jgi:predicted ATPase/DNA-binding winged helix-turn-helix (wHTH) protein
MIGAATARSTSLSIVPLAANGTPATIDRLRFDRFVLTPGERRLTKDDIPIEIGGRSFDLLLALVEQAGRVVPKRELLQTVWPDVVVEDSSLRFHMARLRRILHDGRDDTRLITTQVGVGYAFIGGVRRTQATAAASPSPLARPGARLPRRLDRLIGREIDQGMLAERVMATPLLTITGPAGVGKTSLAVEVAHDLDASFTHGATFVDLAAITDPDRLPNAIAEALGVDIVAGGPKVTILECLRERRQLLVLDNCEHLVQAAADLVEQIAATAPEVRVLATGRQALRARNERVHRLSPHHVRADLATASDADLLACSAVELFLHRAASAGGPVEEDPDTLRTVARMCARLDGLALAIELAAVRAATHGVKATARMLGDGLSLHWTGRRTASPRQRTLKATFDWSYDLLSFPERRVFEQLSKLSGPFSFEAALEAVVGPTLDASVAAAALDELAEKSLILPNDGEYHWAETTQIYARRRFDARRQDETGTDAPRSLRMVVT